MFIHLWVYMYTFGCAQAIASVRRSEDDLKESVLSFDRVGLGD